jgi:6,7-dimethyl-8-ribityllumazine synthase
MIKGLTFVHAAASAAQFDELVSFFSALGFEAGKGWDQPPVQPGSASRGRPFLAPLGNLEFVDGDLPTLNTSLLVEVTSLDAVHEVAYRWLVERRGSESAEQHLTAPLDTHWKSRLFTVEPAPGLRVAFWEHLDPLHGKAVALEGDLNAAGMRFAIVVARWNAVITDRLLQGALDALLRSGAQREDIEIARVPGSWEIPGAARQLAESKKFDAIVCLGCLLRGDTAHYEAIYNETARGIGQSQQETGVPHSFGVLTCETLEQALDRAGLKSGNKGFEAAAAAIEMASLYRKLAGNSGASSEGKPASAGRPGRPA